MFTNLRWRLLTLYRKIWVRALLYSLVGLAAAALAAALGRFVPEDIATKLGADSVESILQVIATSMLSVTIFALSTLVGATASVTNASPRATRLVVEDPTAQGILASFLGVFIFSLVGLIALSSGAYGQGERFVLFVFTLALVGVTLASLIRWIQHITQLGRLGDTIDRLEDAAVTAFEHHRRAPQLGGSAWDPETDTPDGDAVPLLAPRTGYVRHLDVKALAEQLEEDQQVWVLARPGAFVGPNRPMALVARKSDGESIPPKVLEALSNAWLVADTRSFDQDPRFGLCVLAEVASKALSAAVNDVGTAIDVLGRLARVLETLEEPPDEGNGNGNLSGPRRDAPRDEPIDHDHVLVPMIDARDFITDAFRPIARDGAGAVELGLRLQATLAHVARLNPADNTVAGSLPLAVAATARSAVERARHALHIPSDVQVIEDSAAHLLSQYGEGGK